MTVSSDALSAADWTAPRRTHPWSIVVNAVHEARRVVSGLVIAVLSGRALGGGELVGVLVPVGAAALGVLAWARTSFRVAPEEFRLDSGVLFRQSRSARFDRIQAVDLDQSAVARVFGLAELRLQLGGGRHGHFRLACMRQQEAARLRAYLLDRVEQVRTGPPQTTNAGSQSTESEPQSTEYERAAESERAEHQRVAPAPGASGQPIAASVHAADRARIAAQPVAYESGVPYGPVPAQVPLLVVPAGRYLASLALSVPVWVAVLALAASVAAWAAGATQLLGAFVPETVAVVGFAWDRFQRYYGFTLTLSGEAIQLRHGLLNRFAQTVPLSRIQAVEISRPLLWRPAGWARVRMNVAGYAHGGGRGEAGKRGASMLLPVALSRSAFEIVGRLAGVDLNAVPLHPAPERARWRASLWRRGYMYGFDEAVVVSRRGLLHRRDCVIPHAKVQSLHLVQGPWQRRLSLATISLHSTRGPVKVVLRHRDVDEAQRFLEEQSRRSATARRRTAA
ncbi:PH domain-containing protein [Actinocrinis puniceicyclus]|uniref:PH domain-containing protein n=1 Tax=Actinocrinis puniceicyclus TaxID=977794 RepID=A0A8J7WMD2_9ACTN|nr:PH domain-containing protein [Actinocrinis puniceicyclus]MBS2965026.1 PH domain-containing protein [Actinocrinis puniceicyclus]